MIERFAAGEPIVPYPDIAEPMDWTYVGDAAEVLLRALDCPLPPYSAFNVAGDRRPIRDATPTWRAGSLTSARARFRWRRRQAAGDFAMTG